MGQFELRKALTLRARPELVVGVARAHGVGFAHVQLDALLNTGLLKGWSMDAG